MRFVAKRLLLFIAALVGLSILVFLALRVLPGDVAAVMAGTNATAARIAALRTQMGLDRPLPVQYIDWLGGLLHGDLGISAISGRSVVSQVGARAAVTFPLIVLSLAIALLIGLPLGCAAVITRNRRWRGLFHVLAIVGGAVPALWSGLLLILLFLMPLAQYIPMACLAGVLIVVSYNMSGWRTFRALLSNPRADVTVLLLTFSLTVLFDLTVAIEVGLLIACVLFMKRVMETTEISVILDEIDPGSGLDVAVHEEHLTVPRGVEVYEINGPYFFGIATKFEELMAQLGDRPKVRVIRMRKVPFIDSTGIHNLTNLCVMSRREKIEVVLSGVNDTVHAALQRSGFYELLGPDNICPYINAVLERARRILGE